MELRQLRTFLIIANLGSFVQASVHLGYTQSTVTTQIKNLENFLGIKLFDRLGHKIHLTAEGRLFKTYAEQIIQLANESKEAVQLSEPPRGTLLLGTGESISTYKLPRLLHAYRQDYPQVELVLKFMNCTKIQDSIRNNELDCAILINQKVEDSDLTVRSLSTEIMFLIASPNHPLAGKNILPLDLSEHCIILTEPGCAYRATMEKILADAAILPRSTMEVNSIESIKQLVMLGLGISMLPRFTVEKELSSNQLIALNHQLPLPQYRTQLVYHKDKWLSPSLQAFVQTVDKLFPQCLGG